MFRESCQEIISGSINCKSVSLKIYLKVSHWLDSWPIRRWVEIVTCSVSGLISPEVAPPQLQISPSLIIPETWPVLGKTISPFSTHLRVHLKPTSTSPSHTHSSLFSLSGNYANFLLVNERLVERLTDGHGILSPGNRIETDDSVSRPDRLWVYPIIDGWNSEYWKPKPESIW